MENKLFITSLFIGFISICGCTTGGEKAKDFYLSPKEKTLFVSSNYSGYEERHLGEVVRIFEHHGFTPTTERAKSQYHLAFRIEGGGIVTARISLLENSKTLIEASSTNVGFGTVIARPAAIASRVDAAIEEMDKLLKENSL